MGNEELREKCEQYFNCKTIDSCIELLDIYASFLFEAMLNHNNEKVNSQADEDAKTVLQMMITKVLHLKNVLNGIEFNSKKGKKLNNIIDPIIVASLVRNIYETTGIFNLIYRNSKTKNEKEIKYLLWVRSGLFYRGRFASVVTRKESKDKLENEQKLMESINLQIEGNLLFKEMDEKNQGKVKKMIKQGKYLIKFENNGVSSLSWRELIDIMRVESKKASQIYNYLSLYAHPSNVSVFQFKNMFERETSPYKDRVINHLEFAFMMFSVFIADYINLFPTVLETYEKMSSKEQIVINFHNRLARGKNYDINNAYKLV